MAKFKMTNGMQGTWAVLNGKKPHILSESTLLLLAGYTKAHGVKHRAVVDVSLRSRPHTLTELLAVAIKISGHHPSYLEQPGVKEIVADHYYLFALLADDAILQPVIRDKVSALVCEVQAYVDENRILG